MVRAMRSLRDDLEPGGAEMSVECERPPQVAVTHDKEMVDPGRGSASGP